MWDKKLQKIYKKFNILKYCNGSKRAKLQEKNWKEKKIKKEEGEDEGR